MDVLVKTLFKFLINSYSTKILPVNIEKIDKSFDRMITYSAERRVR